MASMDHDLIDLCVEWVSGKNAAYLAKENIVTWYSSLTGRKSDYKWHSMSPDQAVRSIRAIKQSAGTDNPVKVDHLIAACQELDRVYEFGVKSVYKTEGSVFNYLSEAGVDMAMAAADLLAEECLARGYRGLYLNDVKELHHAICNRLDSDSDAKSRLDAIHAAFTSKGYIAKTGAYRPLVDGKKENALMLEGALPREIFRMAEDGVRFKHKIVGLLK